MPPRSHPSVVSFALSLALSACGTHAPPSTDPDGDVDPHYDYPNDSLFTLAHAQAKSTHNSYHVEPPNNDLLAWKYTNLPLDEQFETLGVRHVELDLHLEDGEFHVFHLKSIDDHTTCFRFEDCLATVKRWSDGHRGHQPIVVQLELKDESPADREGFFAELHREILAVWPERRIVTPASIQGGAASVAEGLANGWPSLGATRGKVLFALDEHGALRDAYTHGGKDLDGRLLFPDSDPGEPFAAFMVANNPVGDAVRIAKGLAANMLVRTRADGDGVEAKANDTTNRDAALAVGAQFVSTDYPRPVAWTPYVVTIPGGTPSRCNPVTAPPGCTSGDLESPDKLLTP